MVTVLPRYTSLRDLLRVVRNKRTHFYEMPPEAQKQMGPFPAGFLRCPPPAPSSPPPHSKTTTPTRLSGS